MRSSFTSAGTWSGQRGGGRAGADGVLEDIGHVVVHRLEEFPGRPRSPPSVSPGKPTMTSVEKYMSGPRGPERGDDLQVALAGVGPVHRPQDAVAARLHRQVHELAELGQAAVRGDQVGLEAAGMGGGEADAFESVDGVDAFEQLHKGGDPADGRVLAAAIAGHDLAQERDLANAARDQARAFGDDLLHRPRALVAAGLGDDAERAIHVAALLDGNERADRRDRRLQMVADRVLGAFLLGRCRRSPRGIGTPASRAARRFSR